jgi:hypothetical protein
VTVSPSLTSHLASVPSSIVGESAGILSSIVTVAPHQHVGVELRAPAAAASFRRSRPASADLRLDPLVDVLQLVLVDAHLDQFRLGALDRVAVLAHVLHFLARPVLSPGRTSSAAIAVGVELP